MPSCTLAYPDRFFTAEEWYKTLSAGEQAKTDETKLILHALLQQVNHGPMKTSVPWFGDPVENAKLTTWKNLGNLDKFEAMRLFVRTLEEEHADWWDRYEAAKAPPAPASEATPSAPVTEALPVIPPEGFKGLTTVDRVDHWSAPFITGKRPRSRYQHSALMQGNKLMLIGGNANGRYLNDVQVLDLETLSWSKAEVKANDPSTSKATLDPCAGHSLVPWGANILIVGGRCKKEDTNAGSLPIKELNPTSLTLSEFNTTGPAPAARGGHGSCVCGDQLIIFGGEANKRLVLNDLHILNLKTRVWSKPDVKGSAPAARCDMAMTVYSNRYVCVFGGGSSTRCFGDLHMLDLDTMTWTSPDTTGVVPKPRAGHAHALIGTMWYIVGGGDSTSGMCTTVALDLYNMSWSEVTSTPGNNAVSSEGLSVVPVTVGSDGYLIAFGGYFGQYSNQVHVLKQGKGIAHNQGFRDTEGTPAGAAAPATPAAPATSAPATASPPPVSATPTPPKPAPTPAVPSDEAVSASSNGEAAVNAGSDALKAAQEQCRALEARVRVLEAEKQELTAAASAAPKPDPAIQKKLAAAEARAATVEKDAAEMKAHWDEAMALAEKASDKSEEFKQEANKAKADLATLQTQTASDKEEIATLQSSVADGEAKIFKLEVQVAELIRKVETTETLEKELDSLRKKLASAEEAEAVATSKAKRGGGLWGLVSGTD